MTDALIAKKIDTLAKARSTRSRPSRPFDLSLVTEICEEDPTLMGA
ncbi:hypothetical protein [Gordonia oryzae]|nr:hypothetical protein [Gordonia oryzae]